MLHGAGILSTRTLAGAIAQTTTTVDPPPDTERPQADVKVFIRGQDRSGMLVVESLSVVEEIGARGSASFQLIDKTGNYHAVIGASVRILYNGNVVFAGTIDDRSERTYADSEYLYIDLECVDYNQIADRHLVATTYEEQTLRHIVTDIIDSQSGNLTETMADDGVTYTAGSIVDDQTKIAHVRFEYEYASECFDALSELTGYAWWIDSNKVFHMHETSYFVAPQVLDDDLWQEYAGLNYSEDRKDYRNVQILRGGKAKTEEVTDDLVWSREYVGDGETKVFTVDLPLADKPRIYIDSGSGYVEVDQADIGLREADDDDLDWYYQLDDKEISQNRANSWTPLGATDKIKIEFQGYVPILQEGRVEEEIYNRAVLESGTGVYQNAMEERNIDDRTLARDLVDGMLRRYATIPRKLRFSTTTHGYHAGQMLHAFIPRHAIDGTYVIDKLSFDMIADDPTQPFRYAISATYQQFRGCWTDWYKRLMRKGRLDRNTENETLQLLRTLKSPLEVSDALTYELSNTLVDWGDDDGTWCVIDNMTIGDARGRTEAADSDAWPDGFDAVAGPVIGLPLDLET